MSRQFRSCAAPGGRSGDTEKRPGSALKRIASRLAFALALVAGAACLAEPAAAQDDTTPPKLIANNAISVTSTGPYGVGDVIEITATFNETVVVTTSGNPVTKPSIDVIIGGRFDFKNAVYHSGSGSTALAFRYTVVEGDTDDDGIVIGGGGVKLGFGGAKIADEAGNEARLEGLNAPQRGPLAGHKVDTVRPTVTGVSVHGTTLTITFDETLGAAANLANSAFAVKKTPAGGNPQAVSLSGSPSISGDTVTLTLATAVVATDTGIKVSYTAPTTGTDNTIRDAAGNDAQSFVDKVASTNPAPRFPENAPTAIGVAENTAPGSAVATVAASDPDGDTLTYSLTSPGGGHHSFAIDGDGQITVAAGATLNHERQQRYTIDVQVRDNKDAGGTPDTSVDATHRVIINVTDVDEPPGTPTGVTVTGASSTSVRVTWTAPDRTGKPATTGYDIRWFQGNADPDQDSQWTERTLSGTATSTTIGQLTLGSTYRVQVRAKNHEGTGPWSDSGSGIPVPPAPAGCSTDSPVQDWIASVTSTASSITVTLNDPPQGGAIEILVCRSSGQEVGIFDFSSPRAGSHMITRLGRNNNSGAALQPDTDYWVRVYGQYSGNHSVWHHVRTKRVLKVSGVALVSTPTVDADGDGTNDTYKPGDTVRARVTFSLPVDVTGSPVLKLQLAGNSGERTMAFDTSLSRTNTTTLEFTYTVAAGDLAKQGIAFEANKLSAGTGAAIRRAGTQQDAPLAFARVGHAAGHKVDGVVPALVATDPVRVTSSAGPDDTYAIGDTIEVTARFDEAVIVTTAGNPVTGPRVRFSLGGPSSHVNAVYHSGSGTTALVFRYTVAEGDIDADGISFLSNALGLQGGGIADAAGHAATVTQLEHGAIGALARHKVEAVRPRVTGAAAGGTTLAISFDEALGAAASLANSAFTVKKTSGGSDGTVSLSGSPSIRGNIVTLTLATAVAATDTGVKVSYTVPSSGTDNKLRDVVGNTVNGFTDQAVTKGTVNAAPAFPSDAPVSLSVAENSAAGTAVGAVAATDPDGDALTYALSSNGNDHEAFAIDGTGAITVASGATLDHETKSTYSITVSVHDGKNLSGATDTTVDASRDLTVTVTDVEERLTVSAVELVSTATVDADGDGTNETYKPGNTVRARVTFSSAVNVTGSPVLKLQFAEDSGEKSMTFDTGRSRTNTTTLEFTYRVVAGDLSADGIAFFANKLSVGPGASIRGTQSGPVAGVNANLAFAKVDHDPDHRVDGVAPRLIRPGALTVTSSPGDDETYAIGEVVEVTAHFTEAVRLTRRNLQPSLRPYIAIGPNHEPAGGFFRNESHDGTAGLVFRITVAEGVSATNGVSMPANALNPGRDYVISDAAGNRAGTSDIAHSAHRFADHKIDAVRPKVTLAELDGTTLTVTFSETLGAAASLANSAFTVKATSQGSERPVSLSGSVGPAISGDTLTLTLASAVPLDADNGVSVGYAVPTTGTDNKVRDVAGNTANGFSAKMVTAPTPTLRNASVDGATLTLTFSARLNTAGTPAASAFTVSGTDAATSVTGVAFKSGDATRVELTLSPAVGQGESGVTVDYAPPTANPLQDTLGNKVAGFTGESVSLATNFTPGFLANAPTELSLAENNDAGAAVGTVAATDPDGDTLSYRLDLTSDTVFDIDGTGAITVTEAGALDHEAKPSWPVRVSVSDGKASDGSADSGTDAIHDLTITVTDVDEPPDAAPTGVNVAAASSSSVRVTWTAPDMTGKPALTGYDVRWFKGSADPDREGQWSQRTFAGARSSATISGLLAASTYRAQVRAKNDDGDGPWSASGSGSTTEMVPTRCSSVESGVQNWIASVTSTRTSITVTLNDPLPNSGGITLTVCRSSSSDWERPVILIPQPAAGSYTITNFGVNNTGPALKPDTDYWVRVTRYDYNSNWGVWHRIRTKPNNAAPGFPDDAPTELSVAEDSAAGAAVGTVAATDPDGDTLTYSLDTASDAVFDIDGDGAITLTDAGVLDHEAKPSWSVTVSVSDGKGLDFSDNARVDATHDLTIAVTDVDEPPDAPTGVTVTGASLRSVTASWTAPDVTGKPVLTDYDVRWFKGESDPASEADWVEPGEAGGHDHVGTQTTAEIGGLDLASAYRVQVRAKNEEGASGWSDSGGGSTVSAPTVSSVALVSEPAAGQNDTYKVGDTVRARVTFSAAVDVAGSPVLKLQFDPEFGEKTMTFDASQGRTNTTTLDFTYTVASGNRSPQGIALYANKLSVGGGVSIRKAGTTADANLAYTKVDHDADHKVDGDRPKLIASNPVTITSTPGDDGFYAVGDAIEVTATFDEAVTVTTAGNPIEGPRFRISVGGEFDLVAAPYHSGSGTTALAFRYTVAEGDTDTDGIALISNVLGLQGGKIKDAAGNEATTGQLAHDPIGTLAGHKVDGVRPTVKGVAVDGTTLTITFTKTLGAASSLANSAFTVKKTPAGGSEQTVSLSGSPSISSDTVTLTLASAVSDTDFGIKVRYDAPTTGTDNTIRDVAGNDVESFPYQVIATGAAPRFPPSALTAIRVAENTAPGTVVGTVAATDPDDDSLTYTLTSPGGGHHSFAIDGDGQITVAAGATLNYEQQSRYTIDVQASDNKDSGGSPDTSVDATHRVTVTVTDVDEPPDASPTGLTVTGTSSSGVSVSWAAPSWTISAGWPQITGFDVRWFKGSADPDQESQWTWHTHRGTTTQTNINRLDRESAYRVQVRAKNHEGAGPWSDSGSGSTTATAPTTPDVPAFCNYITQTRIDPDTLFSVTSTETTVTVTVKANANVPASAGGDVFICEGSSVLAVGESIFSSIPGTVRTATDLTGDTDYWVQLHWYYFDEDNEYQARESVWKHIRTTTPAHSPPSFLSTAQTTLRIAENNAEGAVVGTAPAADPDGDALTYTLAGANAATFTIDASGKIAVAAGVTLDHETKSRYSITAQVTDSEDGDGETEGTPAIDATLALTVIVTDLNEPPDRPAAPEVTDGPSPDSLSVSWSAPSTTGPAINDYDLRYRASGQTGWTDWAQGSGTTATITGLAAGTNYQVQVRATNAEGTSDWSESGGDVDNIGPSAVFSPADGGTLTDATGNVTLSFAEAIHKDATGTALANTDLGSLLTLKTDDENGTAIAFTATIDAAKRVITLDPDADLAEGPVYVAITSAYFDAAGNQGSAANATFTVDTSVAAPVFSPADGAAVTSATGNITLSFGEAIHKDAAGGELADTDLGGLLTLKKRDSTGDDINFTASIDAAKKVITLDPSADLADGPVYVAITNGYFDAQGNQGSAASATFRVDTTGPSAVFSPADGGTLTDATGNVTLSFAEAIHKDATGTALANTDLGSLLTLKTDDENGTAIAFTATIDAAKRVITLDPDADLAEGPVYVAITSAYFDAAGNQGSAANATFTVDTSVAAPVFSPADGAAVTSATGNITLSFGEAIHKDAAGGELADTDLGGLLTLKKRDSTGDDINFTASIDAAKKVITLDPSADLADGPVYVAITNGYFDAQGNQGSAASATFRVDTTGPSAVFSPADGGTLTDATGNVTLSFAEAIHKDATGTALANTDLGSLLTLKTDDENGTAIAFTATIDAAKRVITLDPDADLAEGPVYVAITSAYFDAAGNQGSAANATFTVDTSVAAPVFSPADGAAVTSATGNITLSFGEAIHKDAAGGELADTDLGGLLTLKKRDSTGDDINFTASIDAAKKVITLDPSADLADGPVYVAITNGYFDAQGNQGSAASATFRVDTTGPSAVFSPADGGTLTDATGNVTLSFAEAIHKDATGTALANTDLGSLLTLKTDDENGTAIAFTATIDAAKRVITLDPDADLAEGPVYVAITSAYFDAAGNQGSAANATFTVDTSVAAPVFSPADGAAVTSATGNITLSFGEAIHKDAAGGELADTDLGGLLTLKKRDSTGDDINFTASIDAAKKVITLDPSADLADGPVYVAITNGYFDAQGNQGSAASATFRVDTTGPSAVFSPADGGTLTDATGNVTLSFAEAIHKDATGTALANTDLGSLLTLKTDDENGTAIAFTATIDAAKRVITLDPDADLAEGPVYVAITSAYFDAAGNQGSAANATFTVDTSVAAPVFSPADGAAVTSATGNITLSFGEAIHKDAAGGELADTDLGGLLTLKKRDSTGDDINFTASIDAAKKVITLDPSADLADGPVYVAITNGYFDAQGNQGSAASATFRVDTTGPSAVFSPADGGTLTDATGNVTLSFAEAIHKDATGTALANTDLGSLLTLKTDDENGTAIAFTATIDAAKRVITLDPDADLAEGPVYVAITSAYFDAAGNQGSAANATFTVDTSVAAPVFSPADGAAVTSATGNITLSFGEAIHKDAAGGELADTDLGGLLTLKKRDSTGDDINFTASIDAAKKVITLDPSADLADGPVYVAITNGYFDAQGNQGSAASATFRVDTTGPSAVFSPADGGTLTDATGNVTLSFAEAIHKDATGTALANTDLGSLLTLKTDDENGTAIAFTATIDAAKRVITLDPDADLAEGPVYVAITSAYFDAAGNQGSAANATFRVDTTGPSAVFSPADGGTLTDATGNVTLSFAEAIHKDATGTALANTDLGSLLTLKTDDENGTAIAFTATIDAAKRVITLDPDADLAEGPVYVAITSAYFDAAGNQGSAANATFTVDTSGVRATVAGTMLTLSFPEDLNTAMTLPAVSAFSITGTAAATSVTAVAFRSGAAAKLDLTLNQAVAASDTPMVSYSKPTANSLQYASGSPVASFTGAPVTKRTPQVTGPRVSSVTVTSGAGADNTYAIGETISLTATFNENVVVTTAGTPVEGPRIPFTLGSGTKQAVYASGSGTTELVFSYTVVENDEDTDGIHVAANALALNGGAIKNADNNNATLDHAAVAASANHKVDGVRPTVSSAAVDASDTKVLTLTFDKNLVIPDARGLSNLRFAFIVQGGGSHGGAPVINQSPTQVAVSGATVTLTLGAGIAPGRPASVHYTAGGVVSPHRLRDGFGNPVAEFDEHLAASTAGPAPVLARATVEGSTLTLFFDRDLDAALQPAGSRFEVSPLSSDAKAVGTGTAVVAGATVTVTLKRALAAGGSAWVRYEKGDDAHPLRSTAGDEVADFVNWRAAGLDGTGPDVISGSVSGTDVTVYFDEALDTGSVPAATAFPVTVAGTARTVDAVAVRGTAVFLTLASAAGAAEAVTVGYNKPTGASASRLRDTAGNETDTFSSITLTNEPASDPGKPALAATEPAVADANRLTLTFDQPLDPTSVPANEAFILSENVYAGVIAVMVHGARVELSLGRTMHPCDSGVTVRYAKIASNALRNRWGTEADGFTGQAVVVRNARADAGTEECLPNWLQESSMGSVILRAKRPFERDAAPDVAWFTVTASGGPVTVTGAAFDPDDAHELKLTLSRDPAAGETVTVSYRRPLGALGLWDIDGNQLGDLVDVPVTNDATDAPAAGAVAVVSEPGTDGTYASGDAIRVRVAFGEAVTVDTNEGAPRLKLDLGGEAGSGERWAVYESGSGETALAFAYTVVSGDASTAGVAVLANTLEANGGTIRSVTTGALADLAHAGLGHDPQHKVDWRPGLRVADAQAREGIDSAVEFQVSLSRAASETVTVDYATADGTAVAGEDYTATSGTLTFAVGESEKTVAVPILDDDHDEGLETFTFRLANAEGARITDGQATGTIANTDPIPKAWLARFGRTVTDQVVDAVRARLAAPRAASAQVALAGQTLPPWTPNSFLAEGPGETPAVAGLRRWKAFASPQELNSGSGASIGPQIEDDQTGFTSRPANPRDLLTGTSFALTAGTGGPGGGFASVWGHGAISSFSGREGSLTLDGAVTTGFLGADWTSNPASGADRWTAGLTIGHSIGTGDYQGTAGTGDIEATLTGVYPYAGADLNDRLSVWATGGWGTGEVTVTPEGRGPLTADLSMHMGAAGMRSREFRPTNDNGLRLAVKGDARFTHTESEATATTGGNLAASEAGVWQARAGIEGRRPVELHGDGANMTPSFEIGLRLDGGDAEKGFGADLGGGLAFADPKNGMEFGMKARGLVVHGAPGFQEWGASASFAWDPRPSTDRGLALSFTRSLGASPSGGMDALLDRETLAGLAANDDSSATAATEFKAEGRLEGTIGYGQPLFGGDFTGTPSLGFGLSDGGERDYRIGWRLTSEVPGDPGFEVKLDATRREPANGDAAVRHGVMLRGTIRW